MANEDKYPRNIGKEIPVAEARQEMAAWQRANPGKPATFRIDPKLISTALGNAEVHGIRFCNGYDESNNFAPVMAGINAEGKALITINTNGLISIEEYKACRNRWEADNPKGPFYFYIGSEILEKLIDSKKPITAAYTINKNGDNNAVLLTSPELPEGEDDDGAAAFNDTWLCPPFCPNGE